jgi:uncharacterized membrane protein
MQVPERKPHSFETFYAAFFETKFFPDLMVVLAWLTLAIVCIYFPLLNESPFRIVFTLPVVLFIPGYALIAALFPGSDEIDLIERIALSFGLSIAIVPLTGLALNYTPWGIRLDPIVISLTILTVALILIAQYRRALLLPDTRYRFPAQEIAQGMRDEFFPTDGSRTDRILSIVLLISIIAAVGTTIFVIAVPKEGEKFTEFYILGEKKMAADYPDRVEIGQQYPMYVGIGNHEYRNISYTVETHLLMMNFDEATNESWISDSMLLDITPVFVPDNETVMYPYNLTIPRDGFNRVEFLLFNETVPGKEVTGMERINQSYRDLHLWVKILN